MVGNSLRQRIRQISVDDSNSMSNIAQLIMDDIKSSSPYPLTDAAEDSSDVDLSATHPAMSFHTNEKVEDDALSQSNHF